jgi:hypothetical protein
MNPKFVLANRMVDTSLNRQIQRFAAASARIRQERKVSNTFLAITK